VRAWRKLRARLLAYLGPSRIPIAWFMLGAGCVTFVGVVIGLFTVGDAKLATLIVAADLFASGLDTVLSAEADEEMKES